MFEKAKEIMRDYLESGSWPRRPECINFEITAACDARCVHCPRQDMDRPMASMPFELFKKMVDQAHKLRVPALCPNGYGEICTIPLNKLKNYLSYIESKKSFKIIVNTNGNRLSEEYANLFIEHKVHLVNITIDGATKETAESIRVGLDFDRIEANIKRLLDLRKTSKTRQPKIRVGMVAMPQNSHEVQSFQGKWRGLVDFVGIGGFSSRLNSVEQVKMSLPQVDGQNEEVDKKSHACVLPFRDLNIWSDGKAVLCCEDWNEEYVVGDLNTQTIIEIWHGKPFKEVREKHLRGRGGDISMCGRCNAWKEPTFGARLWS